MELIPVWNGTLEHDGKAAGLSAYVGRSSLHHSPNWERLDALEHGEAKERGEPGKRGHDRKPRAPKCDPAREAQALEMLRRGVSYGDISRALNVSTSVPRRLARRQGISRAAFAGAGNRLRVQA